MRGCISAAIFMLLVSYFGDTDGVMRHVFPALEMLRLLMWLSMLVLVDAALQSSGPHPNLPAAVTG